MNVFRLARLSFLGGVSLTWLRGESRASSSGWCAVIRTCDLDIVTHRADYFYLRVSRCISKLLNYENYRDKLCIKWSLTQSKARQMNRWDAALETPRFNSIPTPWLGVRPRPKPSPLFKFKMEGKAEEALGPSLRILSNETTKKTSTVLWSKDHRLTVFCFTWKVFFLGTTMC